MADNSPEFYVHTPPPLLARLRAWIVDMKAAGRGPEYYEALKEMNRRLETDPDRWGDPLHQYHHMRGLEARGSTCNCARRIFRASAATSSLY